jgi:site-specific recombinase XerD
MWFRTARDWSSDVCSSDLFSLWLKDHGLSQTPLKELTNDNIADFFVYIARDKDLDRPTCEKYCHSIKSVFQFFEESEQISKLPFKNVTYPINKRDCGAQVITTEHLKILLEDMKKTDKQLYLAFMTQFYCCLRPGKELRLLKVGEISFANGTVVVNTENAKTGNKRIITIPKQLIDLFYEYAIDKYDKTLYVFGNNKRGEPGEHPWSENMLRYRFNKFRDKYNMPKEYKFYSAKHCSATLLHNSGASLLTSMSHLGHSNIGSHQHYLHKHNGTVNEIIRDHYPNPY